MYQDRQKSQRQAVKTRACRKDHHDDAQDGARIILRRHKKARHRGDGDGYDDRCADDPGGNRSVAHNERADDADRLAHGCGRRIPPSRTISYANTMIVASRNTGKGVPSRAFAMVNSSVVGISS